MCACVLGEVKEGEGRGRQVPLKGIAGASLLICAEEETQGRSIYLPDLCILFYRLSQPSFSRRLCTCLRLFSRLVFYSYEVLYDLDTKISHNTDPQIIALAGPHTYLLVTEPLKVMTLFLGHPEILKEKKM